MWISIDTQKHNLIQGSIMTTETKKIQYINEKNFLKFYKGVGLVKKGRRLKMLSYEEYVKLYTMFGDIYKYYESRKDEHKKYCVSKLENYNGKS